MYICTVQVYYVGMYILYIYIYIYWYTRDVFVFYDNLSRGITSILLKKKNNNNNNKENARDSRIDGRFEYKKNSTCGRRGRQQLIRTAMMMTTTRGYRASTAYYRIIFVYTYMREGAATVYI
jgi:hypothetical protein